jgi:hypothetical protein
MRLLASCLAFEIYITEIYLSIPLYSIYVYYSRAAQRGQMQSQHSRSEPASSMARRRRRLAENRERCTAMQDAAREQELEQTSRHRRQQEAKR